MNVLMEVLYSVDISKPIIEITLFKIFNNITYLVVIHYYDKVQDLVDIRMSLNYLDNLRLHIKFINVLYDLFE
jgi:hypothetical protein